jgi:hypothetical protein
MTLLSGHKFHIPASEAGIAIYRVVLVRQLFGRLEQDYGTFISGISIPFRTGNKHSGTLNRRIGIVTRFRTIEAEAVDIDHEGGELVDKVGQGWGYVC